MAGVRHSVSASVVPSSTFVAESGNRFSRFASISSIIPSQQGLPVFTRVRKFFCQLWQPPVINRLNESPPRYELPLSEESPPRYELPPSGGLPPSYELFLPDGLPPALQPRISYIERCEGVLREFMEEAQRVKAQRYRAVERLIESFINSDQEISHQLSHLKKSFVQMNAQLLEKNTALLRGNRNNRIDLLRMGVREVDGESIARARKHEQTVQLLLPKEEQWSLRKDDFCLLPQLSGRQQREIESLMQDMNENQKLCAEQKLQSEEQRWLDELIKANKVRA